MNTRPNATTILCYGDSNTFGQRSDDVHKGRWPADVRWTGQLQNRLDDDFYVIEEGLSSRTTDIDYTKKPGRNGKTYLLPCLQSHNPIDIVVLMLGTNDFKKEFQREASHIAKAIDGLLEDIATYAKDRQQQPPRVVVVSPPLVNAKAPRFASLYQEKYGPEAVALSESLAPEIAKVARARGHHFIDAAATATTGEDGMHLARESHAALAEAIALTISDLLE